MARRFAARPPTTCARRVPRKLADDRPNLLAGVTGRHGQGRRPRADPGCPAAGAGSPCCWRLSLAETVKEMVMSFSAFRSPRRQLVGLVRSWSSWSLRFWPARSLQAEPDRAGAAAAVRRDHRYLELGRQAVGDVEQQQRHQQRAEQDARLFWSRTRWPTRAWSPRIQLDLTDLDPEAMARRDLEAIWFAADEPVHRRHPGRVMELFEVERHLLSGRFTYARRVVAPAAAEVWRCTPTGARACWTPTCGWARWPG